MLRECGHGKILPGFLHQRQVLIQESSKKSSISICSMAIIRKIIFIPEQKTTVLQWLS